MAFAWMRRLAQGTQAPRRAATAWTVATLLSLAPVAMAQEAKVLAPKEHVRTVDQTFLTFPEWFLVFSPAEYAEYLMTQRASDFPFFGHIGQFWRSYKAVYDETVNQQYEFNGGYHLMVMVIGASTSLEYGIKAAYESTVGRLTEGFAFKQTPEDKFSAQFAQDYVKFIRDLPWYQFDFIKPLRALWTDVPWFGDQPVRKWERRFALTSELLAKAAYGRLIGLATGSIYETPLMVTAVAVKPSERLNQAKTDKFADIQTVKVVDASTSVITIPRYERFTAYAIQLASAQLDFVEIAGNQSIILVSMIGPSQWRPNLTNKILIEQPILTVPGRKRVVATVNVTDLANALRTWATQQVEIEHLFDY